jgi:drug/metabolite transporter (DMT)-like permease
MTLLLDIAPVAGGVGLLAVGALLLVGAGVAFAVYKMLKRTVKMAIRLAIVGVILLIAIAGSIALWAFSGGGSERPRPPRSGAVR